MSSEVYTLDPLTDNRWTRFVQRHPDSSIFHTRGWLEALRRTYDYKPIAFTTTIPSEELSNGWVFCHVKSWLTGPRLVSLPFSDHCEPLADDQTNRLLHSASAWKGSRYLEIRPRNADSFEADGELGMSEEFRFQAIDLTRSAEEIYRSFHDSCIRRKIKRAEKENLQYEAGRSQQLLSYFRRLLLLTRRRHKLPPQPAEWFRNIVHCLGDSATIHLLTKDGQPIASVITLKHRNTLVYKYGCSDASFHPLGGMPLLFWKVIQRAKDDGIKEFDLGRSALDDPGLISFKTHLGAATTPLCYFRSPAPKRLAFEPISARARTLAGSLVASLPSPLLSGAGRLLYRHLG